MIICYPRCECQFIVYHLSTAFIAFRFRVLVPVLDPGP